MTHNDRGHYRKKHSPDRRVAADVAKAVIDGAVTGQIPCARAFEIATHLDVQPNEVGFTADFLEIPIIQCQLGLFGYGPKKKMVKPADPVPKALEKAITSAAENGRISCAAAWDIAKKLGVGKMAVSSACEALKIKVFHCQLGAF